MTELMNELIYVEAVYRAAPATPGLLIKRIFFIVGIPNQVMLSYIHINTIAPKTLELIS